GHLPAGEHRQDLNELIDFGATLCGLAGIARAPGMRGRDLFHSSEPETVFGIIELGPTRRAAARTRRYRFDCTLALRGKEVAFDQCDPNLFDLEADPYEERNLAADPGSRAIIKDMYGRIRAWTEL
ncbi:MAG: hypothetical protein M1436_07360, partial [Acidobacteria bacterium]|nr:hypothetical protein [Acidobacteriota bacterium]